MLITKFIPVLLASVALASPLDLESRAETPAAGAKAVIAAVKKITAGIKSLNATVNKLTVDDPMGIIIAEQIMQQTTDLENDIKAGISAAKSSPKWNQNLSLKVGQSTLNLQPKVKSLLNNIVEHKPAFASAVLLVGDLSKTVEKSLITQQGLTKSFGEGIKAKLAKGFGGLATQTINQINGYFVKAIKAYKNCSGVVCLPPIGGG